MKRFVLWAGLLLCSNAQATDAQLKWQHQFEIPVSLAAFRPGVDGTQIALAWGQGGSPVQIWDMNTNACMQEIAAPKNAIITAATWSLDGKKIALGLEKTIVIYNVETAQYEHTLEVSTEPVNFAQLWWSSAETLHVLPANRNREGSIEYSVWNSSTGTCERIYSIAVEEGALARAMSRGERFLAVSCGASQMKILRVSSGECVHTLSFQAPALAARWSPDGAFLAIGFFDYSVVVLNSPQWTIHDQFQTSTQLNTALAWRVFNGQRYLALGSIEVFSLG